MNCTMKRNIRIHPKDSYIGDARQKSPTLSMPLRDKKLILFKSLLSSKRPFPHCEFSNINNSFKRFLYRNVYRGKNCQAPSFPHCALLLEYHTFKLIFHIEKLREREKEIEHSRTLQTSLASSASPPPSSSSPFPI